MKVATRICTCNHMISMHSQPKKGNGGTRPCFFSGCGCEHFTDQTDQMIPTRVGDVIEVEPGFSPSSEPEKPAEMSFGEAMALVSEGRLVSRLEWGDKNTYVYMFMWGAVNPKTPAGKYLSIHHADGNIHPLYLNDGDLAGNDWIRVEN